MCVVCVIAYRLSECGEWCGVCVVCVIAYHLSKQVSVGSGVVCVSACV